LINADTGKLEHFKNDRMLSPVRYLVTYLELLDVSLQEYQKTSSSRGKAIREFNQGSARIF
jgi:hypothetical protein